MDLVELKLSIDSTRHPWELARLAFLSSRIQNILKSKSYPHNETVNIIDVGSGDGFLVANLADCFKRASFTAIDINYTPEILSTIKNEYDKPNLTFQTNYVEQREGYSRIDIVLFLDVIEHIEDEIAVLKDYNNQKGISTDTFFLITVPAFQDLFTRHDRFLGHYRRYNKKSLKERLNSAGLVIEDAHYFFSTLLLPRAIQKVLERGVVESKHRKVYGIARWSHGTFVTNLIRDILIADAKLCANAHKFGVDFPGLSLYCLCRPV